MTGSGYFWGPVPVYVLQDHRHKAGHLRVLAAILSCPSPHFPSLMEIAERSGHTKHYCSKMVSEMVKFGTLEREQRYRATNVYRLTGFQSESTRVNNPESTTVVESESTAVVGLKEQLKEYNGSLSGYGYFCSAYPRMRLGSAREIKDFWIVNGLEKDADQIVKAVNSFKDSDDWQKQGGQFIPRAMKFLDEERWRVYSGTDPLSKYEED